MKPPLGALREGSRSGSRLVTWLPALVWMAVIFIGSTSLLSSSHTSRFLVPFIHWLRPDISDRDVETLQFLIRKGGHLTEYAILAALYLRGVGVFKPRIAEVFPRWDSSFWIALSLSALYAITDEFHQGFVAGRDGSAVGRRV